MYGGKFQKFVDGFFARNYLLMICLISTTKEQRAFQFYMIFTIIISDGTALILRGYLVLN